MTLLRHYWSRLRAADRAWSERRADLDDSPDFFQPSVKVAATVFLCGLAVALIGISKYLGLI